MTNLINLIAAIDLSGDSTLFTVLILIVLVLLIIYLAKRI